MFLHFLHGNLLLILSFLVACILAFCLIRLRSRKESRKVISLRDIDPDSLPDLKKKILWVKIQVFIGLSSLIIFIVFFGIGNLFS